MTPRLPLKTKATRTMAAAMTKIPEERSAAMKILRRTGMRRAQRAGTGMAISWVSVNGLVSGCRSLLAGTYSCVSPVFCQYVLEMN